MVSFDDLIPKEGAAPQASLAFDDLIPPQPDTMGDVSKSVVSGLDRGVAGLVGAPADLGRLAQIGVDKAKAWWQGRPENEVAAESAKSFVIAPETLKAWGGDAIHKGSGLAYEPKTTAGKYASSAAEFVPGALLGPGSVARNVVKYGIAPGLASEAGGQLTEGTSAEPYGRIAGALMGIGGVAGAEKAITPFAISPERQAVVNALQSEGVKLTAGQKSGSKPLQWMESTLGDMPGAGAQSARIADEQGQQFTAAAMRRTGSDARLATPEAINEATTRIGGQFDALSARNSLVADTQLGQDLGKTLNEYAKVLPTEQKAKIGELTSDIVDKFRAGGGKMAGDEYQATRSRLTRMASNNAQTDRDYAEALRGLRDALDKGMSRSISPADKAAWETARKEWGNLKVIEKAATGAGERSAQGYLSPSQLRTAVAGNNRTAYARGQGDLASLARAGEAVLKPLPNSGTAPRMNVMNLVNLLSGAGGMAAGGPVGAVAGLVAPAVAGRVLHSRPMQAYLGNQALAASGAPARDKIAQLLLASRSAAAPTLQFRP